MFSVDTFGVCEFVLTIQKGRTIWVRVFLGARFVRGKWEKVWGNLSWGPPSLNYTLPVLINLPNLQSSATRSFNCSTKIIVSLILTHVSLKYLTKWKTGIAPVFLFSYHLRSENRIRKRHFSDNYKNQQYGTTE